MSDQKPSATWSMDDWATYYHSVEAVFQSVERSLITMWVCRHCGHQSPVITEFCDGCGIEDCNHGVGDESARDRELRLSGQRGPTGIWTKQ